MPVVVAGMHRSGTSMVAHALHLAGLYLGAEDELYNEKTDDNPDGYWEHVRFVALNDEVLAELGGGWDTPPASPARWRDDARLGGLRARAKRLLKEFEGHEPWGFKDPRASLVIPLWAELIPELKVVLCVRNPLEVALSLHRRHVSYSTALRLWETYNRRVLETTPPGCLILMDYEAWLEQPAAEIRRVLRFLDMPSGRSVVEKSRSAVQGSLRRNRFTGADLLDLGVSAEIVELYAWLRREAAGRAPLEGAPTLPAASTASERDTAVVDVRRLDAAVLRRRADRLEQQLAESNAALERCLAIEREERARREKLGELNATLQRTLAMDREELAEWRRALSRRMELLGALEEGQSTLLARVDGLEEGMRLGIEGLEERALARSEGLDERARLGIEGLDERARARAADQEERLLARVEDVEERLLARVEDVEQQVLVSVEDVQGSVYDLQAVAPEGTSHEKAEYQKLLRRIKEVVRDQIPRGSTVLVVSRGDGDLTSLYGRRAWHFPRAADGGWAGYHPKSSLPAIAHLEALRAEGADHLLIPATSMWWLGEYTDFRRHLEEHHTSLFLEDGVCAIFALGEAAESAPDSLRELREVVASFQSRFRRDPALLDWSTGLDLSASLLGAAVFSPPVEGDGLPYVDGSIDLVVLVDPDPADIAQAERVASAAVVVLSSETDGADVRWKPEVGLPTLPSVSIVIPCHDGIEHTTACLETLLDTLPHEFAGEIMVVDDASTDGTAEWLDELAERHAIVTVLRNTRNLGFLASCNRAAEAASSELLLFLNNDTILLPGWLPPLLRVFAEHKDAGAVGGRLLYPDGRLQEAGGLVFRDGSAWKFGYGDSDPEAPIFSYTREVDYCSGCLLATPRSLFLEVGGFDRRFAPGFYEDTDYCLALRERGLRVYYEPESSIVHVEGGTAGTDLERGPKRHQVLNEKKFVRKWRKALERQPDRPEQLDSAGLASIADVAWR